jgi:hypothetical protein
MNIVVTKFCVLGLVVGAACVLPSHVSAKDDKGAGFLLPSSSPMYMPPTGRPTYDERYKTGGPLYRLDANGQYVPENMSSQPVPDNQPNRSGKPMRYAANDRFGLADYNLDGFLNPREAARYPKLQKHFQAIAMVTCRMRKCWPGRLNGDWCRPTGSFAKVLSGCDLSGVIVADARVEPARRMVCAPRCNARAGAFDSVARRLARHAPKKFRCDTWLICEWRFLCEQQRMATKRT